MRAIALLVLLPLAASAQPSDPAPAASPPAPAAASASPGGGRWSIGFGIFSGTETLALSGYAYLGGYSYARGIPGVTPGIPGVTASLERRLSDPTWLVFGVNGAIGRYDQDLPQGDTGLSRHDVNQLTVGGGLRHLLTRAGGVVDVSALALAEAGIVDAEVERMEYAGSITALDEVTYDSTGWLVGASLGVAVDRVLTGGLSVRIATPLLGATYLSTRTRITGSAALDGEDFSIRAQIAPRLELRLAF
jgi:hypothetical protein